MPSPALAAGGFGGIGAVAAAIVVAALAVSDYELVLMLDPEAPDERRDQIASDARSRIEGGGSLKAEKTWGVRKLAYEIQRRNEADYRFYRFETEAPLLDELNHNLKITDGVLRFRIYKVDPRVPVVDPPPPISLSATSGDRPPGRGRRDDRGQGDRPPRAPEPEAQAPAAPDAESAEAPAAATETPATEVAEATPVEAPEAPAGKTQEAPPEAPEAAAPDVPAEPAPAGDDSQS